MTPLYSYNTAQTYQKIGDFLWKRAFFYEDLGDTKDVGGAKYGPLLIITWVSNFFFTKYR